MCKKLRRPRIFRRNGDSGSKYYFSDAANWREARQRRRLANYDGKNMTTTATTSFSFPLSLRSDTSRAHLSLLMIREVVRWRRAGRGVATRTRPQTVTWNGGNFRNPVFVATVRFFRTKTEIYSLFPLPQYHHHRHGRDDTFNKKNYAIRGCASGFTANATILMRRDDVTYSFLPITRM